MMTKFYKLADIELNNDDHCSVSCDTVVMATINIHVQYLQVS